MIFWQENRYLALLLTTALVSVVIAGMAWRRRATPGTRTIVALMCANAVWAVLYALELSTARLEWQVLLAKLQYLGILAIPGLWLAFTIQYTRHDNWLNPLRRLLLFAVPVGFFVLVATNDLHQHVWSTVSQTQHGQAMILNLKHGPGFFSIWVYSYLLLIAGTLLLVRAWFESPPLYRRQISFILAGAAAPWIANLLYVAQTNPDSYLDLTPFAFTLTGLIAAWGLLRYGLLALIPLARNQMIEVMQEAVIVADMQGRVLDVNPPACRLLSAVPGREGPCGAVNGGAGSAGGAGGTGGAEDTGRGAQPWIGQPLEVVLAGWPKMLACCKAALPLICEIEQTLNGKTVYFEVQISYVQTRPGENSARMIVLRDISEHKRVETELREASAAKTNFLAAMSHELRTPLTVIIGYSEMLLEEARLEDRPAAAQRLERIGASAQHLLTLVNDLLDLSRIEAGRMLLFCSYYPVNNLIDEAVAIGRPLAETNQNRFTIEQPGPLGEIYSDPVRVRQVLINLIGNAAKFTHNGEITLRARRWQESDETEWIEFAVSDTGIGIPEEAIPRLFQNFSQVDPSSTRQYGGAGLGLAISQRLCQMMGGTIHVESQLGAGSTFRVHLPARAPEAELQSTMTVS